MSTISFVGVALELESVTQVALATVRVEFTQDPLAVSATGAHDALNPANWSLTGPGVAIITSCNTVPGDTRSIDLFLTGPLAAGTWTVTASANIQTATGAGITQPISLSFYVSSAGVIEAVNVGAVNDTDEDIIRKHLNRALKGGGWDALIAALATGEKTNRQNAQLAFDQLFTSTSSGLYLERKASDNGIDRPDNMGISDDTFRQYVIRLTNNKLTEESLLEILQVFYGDASLRASCTSGTNEPYALQDGDDLQIVLDGVLTVNCIFHTADFASIGQAKAIEVASAITRAFRVAGSKAYATNVTDPVTGISNVVVYSDALGLSSSVKIVSGKAQNVLQFPTKLGVYTGVNSPTWNITVNAAAGTTRFTTTSNTVDLSKLQVGDYVNIYGTEFLSANHGSFAVTSVSVTYPSNALSQYFEIANATGASQIGLAQVSQSSIFYFRPTLNTIHTTSERNVLVSSQSGLVDIVMPATSQAVSRQALSAAYAQVTTPITVSSMYRSSGLVTATATNHGLTAGQWIYIDGATPNITPPTTTAGNGQTTTRYGATTTVSAIFASGVPSNGGWGVVVPLVDNRFLVYGGLDSNLGTPTNFVTLHSVTGSTSFAPNGTQYTISGVTDSNYPQSWTLISAVRLTDPAAGNKVLSCGGVIAMRAGTYAGHREAYLYTPGAFGSTGTWASTGLMADFRAGHALIQRSDYLVHAIGGLDGSGNASATTETYSAVTKTWTLRASLNIARFQPEAIQLNTTDVLVTGGRTSGWGTQTDYAGPTSIGTLTNVTELYSISGNTWTKVGPMLQARVGHRLFLLDDGRVIAIGGIGYDPTQGGSSTAAYLATTEIYDPTLKHWYAGPTMKSARGFFCAARSGNKIYCLGGASNDVEYLDLSTMTFKICPNSSLTPFNPIKATATVLTGGLIVTSTGNNINSSTSNTETMVIVPNNDTFMTGGLNGLFQVNSVPDANTFTYKTDVQDYTSATNATATPVAAPTSTILGPHLYDPAAGVAVTGTETTTTQTLAAGQQYATISVANASSFPDAPGYICLAFGFSNQVTPVPYLGRLSSTLLKLDYNFVFSQTVSSGSKVTLLQQKSPWVPSAPQSAGSFYITDSSAGRIAASSAIDQAAAAGITVNKSVTYPGDRGLGNEGFPVTNNYKVSDRVEVWASDDIDGDLTKARNGG